MALVLRSEVFNVEIFDGFLGQDIGYISHHLKIDINMFK
jgi:hypothetical protein